MEKQFNSIKDGNVSRMTTTFSILQSWRQRGRVDAESTDKITNTQEKSQVYTGDTIFTGVVIGHKKIIKNISRVKEDGILLIVPVNINGKEFSTLIDSGATRCFITN